MILKLYRRSSRQPLGSRIYIDREAVYIGSLPFIYQESLDI